ncbi:hypothetical protein Bca52824_015159 [Brassica carinata]|uniref:Uncharacterized protein n=1 Tax=Brassica carinata TaxID=52824 RepID=A0A8X7W209_BRACI|nr:hypothetical protein Bca52824_015159 [Brassica carinata]
MSPTKTKWLRSWSVESDDDINHIENISSSPTSLMVSPFRFFDDEIYNTKPYLPSTVSSFQTIIDEAIIDETSTETFYPLIVSPLQTLDDKAYNITSPSTLEVGPLQTVDDENHNPKTPSPTLDVPPLPTIDGETHKTEPPLPTPEITLLQTVDNNINNTPPPPLMVSSLLAIVPYEANKDSIASDDGPRHYNDETQDLQTLIYTGHGGQATDQKLGRGNLALEASKLKGNEVRVIRGEGDPRNKNKKIYIYDGLYIVSDSWTAKGKSGFEEFKFKLLRKPGQPAGYANWKSSKIWSKGTDNSRKGLILKDLSYGAENLPIPLVNEIDENDKEMPQDFSYVKSSACSSMMIVQNYQSTACINCQVQLCEDSKCICVQRNGGELPYLNRILVCRKPMVYECGDACPCPPDCHNRVTQTGLKIRVEVFKTEKCGWGLRSLEPIRAGTFICELVGMAKRIHGVDEDDEYMFDSSRYNQFKWNYEPELVGENCWDQVSEAYKLRWRMLVSSKEYGNVSRFMNHSCSPNVMWQPIEFEDSRQPCVRIAFFAMKHIPPLTELRFDYGMSCKTEEVGEDGKTIFKGKKICHCGSFKCQGSFG